MKVYIKFLHKKDVYALDPDYGLRLSGDDFVPPQVCLRCGDTLYIPVDLPDGTGIIRPTTAIMRPFPLKPDFVVSLEQPEYITLKVSKFISDDEYWRLREIPGVSSVSGWDFDENKLNSFTLLVDDISDRPMKHKCKDWPPQPIDTQVKTGYIDAQTGECCGPLD